MSDIRAPFFTIPDEFRGNKAHPISQQSPGLKDAKFVNFLVSSDKHSKLTRYVNLNGRRREEMYTRWVSESLQTVETKKTIDDKLKRVKAAEKAKEAELRQYAELKYSLRDLNLAIENLKSQIDEIDIDIDITKGKILDKEHEFHSSLSGVISSMIGFETTAEIETLEEQILRYQTEREPLIGELATKNEDLKSVESAILALQTKWGDTRNLVLTQRAFDASNSLKTAVSEGAAPEALSEALTEAASNAPTTNLVETELFEPEKINVDHYSEAWKFPPKTPPHESEVEINKFKNLTETPENITTIDAYITKKTITVDPSASFKEKQEAVIKSIKASVPKREPFSDYQIKPIERIAGKCRDMPGILLYHSMGSGKTRTAMAIAANYTNDPNSVTIVVPMGLQTPWRDEMENLSINKNAAGIRAQDKHIGSFPWYYFDDKKYPSYMSGGTRSTGTGSTGTGSTGTGKRGKGSSASRVNPSSAASAAAAAAPPSSASRMPMSFAAAAAAPPSSASRVPTPAATSSVSPVIPSIGRPLNLRGIVNPSSGVSAAPPPSAPPAAPTSLPSAPPAAREAALPAAPAALPARDPAPAALPARDPAPATLPAAPSDPPLNRTHSGTVLPVMLSSADTETEASQAAQLIEAARIHATGSESGSISEERRKDMNAIKNVGIYGRLIRPTNLTIEDAPIAPEGKYSKINAGTYYEYRYNIITYNDLFEPGVEKLFKDHIVIFDEAHNLIPIYKASECNKGQQYFLKLLIESAKRVVLLSGTPIQTEMNDIAIMVNLCQKSSSNPIVPEGFKRFKELYYPPTASESAIWKLQQFNGWGLNLIAGGIMGGYGASVALSGMNGAEWTTNLLSSLKNYGIAGAATLAITNVWQMGLSMVGGGDRKINSELLAKHISPYISFFDVEYESPESKIKFPYKSKNYHISKASNEIQRVIQKGWREVFWNIQSSSETTEAEYNKYTKQLNYDGVLDTTKNIIELVISVPKVIKDVQNNDILKKIIDGKNIEKEIKELSYNGIKGVMDWIAEHFLPYVTKAIESGSATENAEFKKLIASITPLLEKWKFVAGDIFASKEPTNGEDRPAYNRLQTQKLRELLDSKKGVIVPIYYNVRLHPNLSVNEIVQYNLFQATRPPVMDAIGTSKTGEIKSDLTIEPEADEGVVEHAIPFNDWQNTIYVNQFMNLDTPDIGVAEMLGTYDEDLANTFGGFQLEDGNLDIEKYKNLAERVIKNPANTETFMEKMRVVPNLSQYCFYFEPLISNDFTDSRIKLSGSESDFTDSNIRQIYEEDRKVSEFMKKLYKDLESKIVKEVTNDKVVFSDEQAKLYKSRMSYTANMTKKLNKLNEILSKKPNNSSAITSIESIEYREFKEYKEQLKKAADEYTLSANSFRIANNKFILSLGTNYDFINTYQRPNPHPVEKIIDEFKEKPKDPLMAGNNTYVTVLKAEQYKKIKNLKNKITRYGHMVGMAEIISILQEEFKVLDGDETVLTSDVFDKMRSKLDIMIQHVKDGVETAEDVVEAIGKPLSGVANAARSAERKKVRNTSDAFKALARAHGINEQYDPYLEGAAGILPQLGHFVVDQATGIADGASRVLDIAGAKGYAQGLKTISAAVKGGADIPSLLRLGGILDYLPYWLGEESTISGLFTWAGMPIPKLLSTKPEKITSELLNELADAIKDLHGFSAEAIKSAKGILSDAERQALEVIKLGEQKAAMIDTSLTNLTGGILDIGDTETTVIQSLLPFFSTSEKNPKALPKSWSTKNIFQVGKFDKAVELIVSCRTKYHFLPLVYSNFDKYGFQLFSAYLNNIGFRHLIIHSHEDYRIWNENMLKGESGLTQLPWPRITRSKPLNKHPNTKASRARAKEDYDRTKKSLTQELEALNTPASTPASTPEVAPSSPSGLRTTSKAKVAGPYVDSLSSSASAPALAPSSAPPASAEPLSPSADSASARSRIQLEIAKADAEYTKILSEFDAQDLLNETRYKLEVEAWDTEFHKEFEHYAKYLDAYPFFLDGKNAEAKAHLKDLVINKKYVPMCVLLHPDIKEGLSFTMQPEMMVLEVPQGYGNQEQIYARIIRALSVDAQGGLRDDEYFFRRPLEETVNGEKVRWPGIPKAEYIHRGIFLQENMVMEKREATPKYFAEIDGRPLQNARNQELLNLQKDLATRTVFEKSAEEHLTEQALKLFISNMIGNSETYKPEKPQHFANVPRVRKIIHQFFGADNIPRVNVPPLFRQWFPMLPSTMRLGAPQVFFDEPCHSDVKAPNEIIVNIPRAHVIMDFQFLKMNWAAWYKSYLGTFLNNNAEGMAKIGTATFNQFCEKMPVPWQTISPDDHVFSKNVGQKDAFSEIRFSLFKNENKGLCVDYTKHTGSPMKPIKETANEAMPCTRWVSPSNPGDCRDKPLVDTFGFTQNPNVKDAEELAARVRQTRRRKPLVPIAVLKIAKDNIERIAAEEASQDSSELAVLRQAASLNRNPQSGVTQGLPRAIPYSKELLDTALGIAGVDEKAKTAARFLFEYQPEILDAAVKAKDFSAEKLKEVAVLGSQIAISAKEETSKRAAVLAAQATAAGQTAFQSASEMGGRAAAYGRTAVQSASELGSQAAAYGRTAIQSASDLGGRGAVYGQQAYMRALEHGDMAIDAARPYAAAMGETFLPHVRQGQQAIYNLADQSRIAAGPFVNQVYMAGKPVVYAAQVAAAQALETAQAAAAQAARGAAAAQEFLRGDTAGVAAGEAYKGLNASGSAPAAGGTRRNKTIKKFTIKHKSRKTVESRKTYRIKRKNQ